MNKPTLSPRKLIAFYAIAFVLMALVGLAVAELTLRFLANYNPGLEENARFTRDYFQPDAFAGHVHTPNFERVLPWPEAEEGVLTFRTNNRGFREDEPTPLASTHRHRVMVFGDSHTDGYVRNRDSFVNVAERMLTDSGLDVELINAGVGVTALHHQLRLFMKHAELRPDIAVFVFYTGNDYAEIYGAGFSEDPAGNRAALDAMRVVQPFALVEGPRPVRGLHVVHGFRRAFGLLDPIETREEVRRRIFRTSSGALAQGYLQAHILRADDAFAAASAGAAFLLKEVVRETRSRNVRPVFLLLPTGVQAERSRKKPEFARMEAFFALDDAAPLMEERVRRDFTALLERESLVFVDLLPPLQAAPVALFYEKDRHLNRQGHAMVANSFTELLRRLL